MRAKIAIIGGSGFYDFLKGKEVFLSTPYGRPSDKILIADYSGRKIAFLSRHGKKHQWPPHRINYQANLYALKKLGVDQIIAPCAVGSLKPKIKPGSFVICDQFINQTHNRKDTFFNGPKVAHISTAQPYCPELRQRAINACEKLKIPFQRKGTVVVIQGPRFSTKAESNFFAKMADVINMTQYPENVLARELEMCYLNISLITDYDAGLKNKKDIKPVSIEQVIKTFNQNNQKVKELILEMIKHLPEKRNCSCGQALKGAFL